MEPALNRRDLLKTVTIAFTALQLPAGEPGAPLFFTKDEFAMLDRLTELIIPADDHSPGAHEAGVAAYIDRTTAEAFLPEDKSSWRNGLALVDKVAQEECGSSFLRANLGQQTAVLRKLETSSEEKHGFFGQLKQSTAFAYYSSSVGIHQDINYKGNVILEQFVGYDAT